MCAFEKMIKTTTALIFLFFVYPSQLNKKRNNYLNNLYKQISTQLLLVLFGEERDCIMIREKNKPNDLPPRKDIIVN